MRAAAQFGRAIPPRNSAAQFRRAILAQFSHGPSIASTVISYSTTITACQKGGASEEAVRLLEKMQAMQAEEAKQAAKAAEAAQVDKENQLARS